MIVFYIGRHCCELIYLFIRYAQLVLKNFIYIRDITICLYFIEISASHKHSSDLVLNINLHLNLL